MATDGRAPQVLWPGAQPRDGAFRLQIPVPRRADGRLDGRAVGDLVRVCLRRLGLRRWPAHQCPAHAAWRDRQGVPPTVWVHPQFAPSARRLRGRRSPAGGTGGTGADPDLPPGGPAGGRAQDLGTALSAATVRQLGDAEAGSGRRRHAAHSCAGCCDGLSRHGGRAGAAGSHGANDFRERGPAPGPGWRLGEPERGFRPIPGGPAGRRATDDRVASGRISQPDI